MTGHIHKRVHRCRDGRESVRWYVVVDVARDANGRRRQKWHGGFRTRREAEVARARIVSSLHSSTYVVLSRATVSDWVLGTWLPMMATRVKPTTLRGYSQIMQSHILPMIGQRPIQKLATHELDAVYAALIHARGDQGPLGPSTVSNVHRAMHKALADAVDAGILVENIAARAKPPRPARLASRRINVWQPHELEAFLAATQGDRLAAVWRLAAMTGMRRGELLGLRWEDIDHDYQSLVVRRALVDVNYRVIESSTKGSTARAIALDAATAELLRQHREAQGDERVLWGSEYHDDGVVTAWENGTPIHPHALSRMFRRCVRELGLRAIRLHDLRHTHATLALHAGVPLPVLAERLGHHSPAFTLKQYAHALPGMQAVAAAAVADLVRTSASR